MSYLRVSSIADGSLNSSARRGRRAGEIYMDVSHMSVPEIIKSLVELKRSCAYTELENDYMIRYLELNDPELLTGIAKSASTEAKQGLQQETRIQFASDTHTGTTNTGSESASAAAAAAASAATGGATGGSLTGKRLSLISDSDRDLRRASLQDQGDSVSTTSVSMTSSWRSMTLNQNQEVNYPMKLELVRKDHGTFELAIEQLRLVTRAEIRQYTAQVEELRISREEAENTLAEFNEFVIAKGRGDGGGAAGVAGVGAGGAKAAGGGGGGDADERKQLQKAVPLERFIKFIEKWVIQGNGMVEQMRLRTATMAQETRALEKSLVIKEEMASVLMPVDFEQGEIDRRELRASFLEKEANLQGLKRVAGNVALVLAKQRRLVDESKTKLNELRRKIREAKVSTDKFEHMREGVEDEIEQWLEKLEKLKDRRERLQAPSTNQYLQTVVRMNALEREATGLRRSEQIALAKEAMTLLRLKRKRKDEAAQLVFDAKIREDAAKMLRQ